MEIGAIPGHLGKVPVPRAPKIVHGVTAITEKNMVPALTMNWRENEIGSAKNGRERTGIEIEIERGRGTGRETEINDAPEHQTEPQNVGTVAARNDAGVAAPVGRSGTRGKTEKKRGRQRVRESVVAGKTESTIKIGRGPKTRGVKERGKRGGTRKIRRIESTRKKRGINAQGAEAETGNTKLNDLARNAPARAAGAGRKQGRRGTGNGNTAIVRNAHTNAVGAKSARTVENPAMDENM